MKKAALFLVAASILLVVSWPSGPGLSAREDDGTAAVGLVLDRYLQAFRTRDQQLVAQVYAQDDDLVVFGSNPADCRFGWNATREYIRKYFATVDAISITLKDRRIKVHRSGEAAWFSQVLDWKETAGKETAAIAGLRISGVLEKRGGRWLIVQLHASGPTPVIQ